MNIKESKIKRPCDKYSSIHGWILKNRGNALFCSSNKDHKAKRFEWALKKDVGMNEI